MAMTFSARARYLLLSGAIVIASGIQLLRGYKVLIVAIGCFAFLAVGNLIIYLSGSKERALRRQQKRDYFEGKI